MPRIRSLPAGLVLLGLWAPLPAARTDGGVVASEPPRAQSAADARSFAVGGATVATWTEAGDSARPPGPWYSVDLGAGLPETVRPASPWIRMRRATFDPLEGAPDFASSTLPVGGNVHFVQLATRPIPAYVDALVAAGVQVGPWVPDQAYLVRMDADVVPTVAALPFVRWIGPYHGEFRVERALRDGLSDGSLPGSARYSIQVFDKRKGDVVRLAQAIASIGGKVEGAHPSTALVEATLTPAQLTHVAGLDEVLFIDRWGALEADLDIARATGGADYLETTWGWTGEGVRGEVADEDLDFTHPAFQATPPLVHGVLGGSANHGTPVYGILFGDGTGDPTARGICPGAQGIFADGTAWLGAGGNPARYVHTQELVDPLGPWRAAFQACSLGSPVTTDYTTVSTQMDEIVFDLDILVCQSQSNEGTQDSRPQAWAKNVVSVGGIVHRNTAPESDDYWGGTASVGPAADGRLKPDLAHYYDAVNAPAVGGGSLAFSGTSASTPIVAGHFALLFQMWHAGIFGNPTGADPFESRPHASTAKALLVNTARPWDFAGTGDDLTRTHQGWGRPDLVKLEGARDAILVVDEDAPITPLASHQRARVVDPGTPELRVTLAWTDPPGATSAAQHRVNDLSLLVLSPSGAQYWGNHGLDAAPWSAAGGARDTVDTIENVFVDAPEPGTWSIFVSADEVNVDGHVETPAIDADYALVVTGGREPCPTPIAYCLPKPTSLGTLPVIGWTGEPCEGRAFSVTLDDARPNANGLVFFGTRANALPFLGGTLCVKQPVQRGPVTTTDGAGHAACVVPVTAGMVGTTLYYQWWFRDPPAIFTMGLSDGLEVTFGG